MAPCNAGDLSPETVSDTGCLEVKVQKRKCNNPWFETDIVWFNVFLIGTIHLLAIYALPKVLLFQITWQTWIFTAVMLYLGLLGSMGGSHRLFSHKSFKAKTPLKIFLLLCNSTTGQFGAWRWARDHRVHHKYSDTIADPYSMGRGVFFAHVGWTLLRRHPALVEKWKTVDMSDLNSDPILMFEKRHELAIFLVNAVTLPILIPIFGWNETIINSIVVPGALRIVIGWHCIFMINSWGHSIGTKPYDKTMNPTQSALVSFLTLGEGWHNYHHTFPWDYKASELGFNFNPTTTFINACARLGLAYDLREASDDVIRARIARTGDGSHSHSHSHS